MMDEVVIKVDRLTQTSSRFCLSQCGMKPTVHALRILLGHHAPQLFVERIYTRYSRINSAQASWMF
jgi:hypothetical protein